MIVPFGFVFKEGSQLSLLWWVVIFKILLVCLRVPFKFTSRGRSSPRGSLIWQIVIFEVLLFVWWCPLSSLSEEGCVLWGFLSGGSISLMLSFLSDSPLCVVSSLVDHYLWGSLLYLIELFTPIWHEFTLPQAPPIQSQKSIMWNNDLSSVTSISPVFH